MRLCSHSAIMAMTSKVVPSAAASPVRGGNVDCASQMLVVSTRILFGEPSRAGMPNCSAARMNTSMALAMIEGATSGKVTRSAVLTTPAPADSEASSIVGFIVRNAPATMRNTIGAS